MFVERCGFGVQRVDDKESGAHVLGSYPGTLSRIAEQAATEAAALGTLVQAEPSEQHRGDLVRGAVRERTWKRFAL